MSGVEQRMKFYRSCQLCGFDPVETKKEDRTIENKKCPWCGPLYEGKVVTKETKVLEWEAPKDEELNKESGE